jgi:hypothetical protein
MANFYQLLSTFSYKETPKYKFALAKDVTIRVVGYYFGHATFLDQNQKVRMTVNGDVITIFNNYTWDGCSPKYSVGGYWVGTPDYPETVIASLVHDSLCQFLSCKCLKVDKKTIDYIFYGIMRQNRFKLALTYYRAVLIFGGLYHKLGDLKRNKVSCSEN